MLAAQVPQIIKIRLRMYYKQKNIKRTVALHISFTYDVTGRHLYVHGFVYLPVSVIADIMGYISLVITIRYRRQI